MCRWKTCKHTKTCHLSWSISCCGFDAIGCQGFLLRGVQQQNLYSSKLFDTHIEMLFKRHPCESRDTWVGTSDQSKTYNLAQFCRWSVTSVYVEVSHSVLHIIISEGGQTNLPHKKRNYLCKMVWTSTIIKGPLLWSWSSLVFVLFVLSIDNNCSMAAIKKVVVFACTHRPIFVYILVCSEKWNKQIWGGLILCKIHVKIHVFQQ